MHEEKLMILVQGHECLYNLQHKDYDNNLVKDNSWKETAGELHAQDKKLSRRAQPGPVFAHGTTGAKRTVGGPPVHKHLQNKNSKLCNIVTATSLLN
jgi:hypothetical protein